MRKIPRPHASERAIVAEKAFDLICMVKYHGGVCGYNQSQVVLYWMVPLMGVGTVRPLRACANAWAPDRGLEMDCSGYHG